MKKQVVMFLLVILLMASLVQDVSATTVFLTSDHIDNDDNTLSMLNSVKNYIEDLSNGTITVTVDSKAPSPGEGTRAIESSSDVSVNFAAVDAANLDLLSKYDANSSKQIIFVNVGNLNLENTSYIRRAWDDNYSSTNFAGISSPAKFLNDAGISYIQPVIKYPNVASDGLLSKSNDDVNKYIAQEIINDINKANSSKTYDTSLIEKHNLQPSIMAKASKEIMNSSNNTMNGSYNSYSAPQVLYMAATYLNGTGLSEPKNYSQPTNPLEYSSMTKDTYSYYDYIAMGTIIKKYMDENGRAPDSIQYNGATIGYYDLVYNYAKITENHTNGSHMDFARSYKFVKVHDSMLYNIAPYAIVGIIIILAILIIRWLIRRRFNRRRYR